jgi:hypothetical protein
MRQVINRIIYDTSKATVIAQEGNDYPKTDFKHQWETLYRGENGRWFLHGEGGPLSEYAQPVGDMYGGGERISAMDDEAVEDWLESHNFVALIQTHFPNLLAEA